MFPENVVMLAALLTAMVLAMLVFVLWPGLDLRVTALFHDPVAGFSGADAGWPNDLRLGLWRVSEAVIALAIAALVAGHVAGAAILGVGKRVWAYIVLLYLLGPSLLVDGIIKRMWGRARPADTMDFGGTLHFTPPYELSDQCVKNCSFVSGEVSGGVALAASLLLLLEVMGKPLSSGSRAVLRVAILSLPILIALQRIAAGRHFLSDAIFAALFTALVAFLLRIWLFPGPRT